MGKFRKKKKWIYFRVLLFVGPNILHFHSFVDNNKLLSFLKVLNMLKFSYFLLRVHTNRAKKKSIILS